MIHEFFKPASLEEALALKRQHHGSLYLGGGTELNYAGSSTKSECVISLQSLGLNTIEEHGAGLRLGALLTLQELIDSPLVPAVLQDAAQQICFRNIRNMATLGGNIGANRSDSVLIPCLIALSATLETAEDGVVTVEDYITNGNESLILSVTIPEQKGHCRVGKISKSSASPTVLSVAVRIDGRWGQVRDAAIAVGGIAPQVLRLTAIEGSLKSGAFANREALQHAVSEAVAPQTDILGSESYKRYICGVTVADCVNDCMEVAL